MSASCTGGTIAPRIIRPDGPTNSSSGAHGDFVPGVTSRFVYRLKGDRGIWPIAIYDDGSKIYISWGPTQAIPAVFAINDAGGEEMVDGYMRRGDVFVVDRICPKLKFRFDKAEAEADRVDFKVEGR